VSDEVVGAALDLVARNLGIAGVGMPPTTIFDGGNLAQVLVVNDLVRRSRSLGVTNGVFWGKQRHVHAAAGDLDSIIDPYNPGRVLVPPISSYPPVVPNGFDVWIVGLTIARTTGAGTLDGAVVSLDPIAGAMQQAWGVNNSGAAIVGIGLQPLCVWVALATGAAGVNAMGVLSNGNCQGLTLPVRVGRGTEIRCDSTAGTASATFDFFIMTQVVPESMGQDLVS